MAIRALRAVRALPQKRPPPEHLPVEETRSGTSTARRARIRWDSLAGEKLLEARRLAFGRICNTLFRPAWSPTPEGEQRGERLSKKAWVKRVGEVCPTGDGDVGFVCVALPSPSPPLYSLGTGCYHR